jgi:two-component system, NarL family, response regulator, fimbrial Z protein, FimZ
MNPPKQKMIIDVCFADNQPVAHYGMRTFFKNHHHIAIQKQVYDFDALQEALIDRNFNILIIDLELSGLASINHLKKILIENKGLRIIVFTSLSDSVYAPNAIKAGVSAYVNKRDTLDSLAEVVVRVSKGDIIINEDLQRNLSLISKQNKGDRIYRKLSNREVEVLRFLCDGKKNNEIAKDLNLNEKTISTYKLRLLTKLHVTNIVDLVIKAKSLEIV